MHMFVDAYVHLCGEPMHRLIYAHKGPSLAKGFSQPLSILTVETGSHTKP